MAGWIRPLFFLSIILCAISLFEQSVGFTVADAGPERGVPWSLSSQSAKTTSPHENADAINFSGRTSRRDDERRASLDKRWTDEDEARATSDSSLSSAIDAGESASIPPSAPDDDSESLSSIPGTPAPLSLSFTPPRPPPPPLFSPSSHHRDIGEEQDTTLSLGGIYRGGASTSVARPAEPVAEMPRFFVPIFPPYPKNRPGRRDGIILLSFAAFVEEKVIKVARSGEKPECTQEVRGRSGKTIGQIQAHKNYRMMAWILLKCGVYPAGYSRFTAELLLRSPNERNYLERLRKEGILAKDYIDTVFDQYKAFTVSPENLSRLYERESRKRGAPRMLGVTSYYDLPKVLGMSPTRLGKRIRDQIFQDILRVLPTVYEGWKSEEKRESYKRFFKALRQGTFTGDTNAFLDRTKLTRYFLAGVKERAEESAKRKGNFDARLQLPIPATRDVDSIDIPSASVSSSKRKDREDADTFRQLGSGKRRKTEKGKEVMQGGEDRKGEDGEENEEGVGIAAAIAAVGRGNINQGRKGKGSFVQLLELLVERAKQKGVKLNLGSVKSSVATAPVKMSNLLAQYDLGGVGRKRLPEQGDIATGQRYIQEVAREWREAERNRHLFLLGVLRPAQGQSLLHPAGAPSPAPTGWTIGQPNPAMFLFKNRRGAPIDMTASLHNVERLLGVTRQIVGGWRHQDRHSFNRLIFDIEAGAYNHNPFSYLDPTSLERYELQGRLIDQGKANHRDISEVDAEEAKPRHRRKTRMMCHFEEEYRRALQRMRSTMPIPTHLQSAAGEEVVVSSTGEDSSRTPSSLVRPILPSLILSDPPYFGDDHLLPHIPPRPPYASAEPTDLLPLPEHATTGMDLSLNLASH